MNSQPTSRTVPFGALLKIRHGGWSPGCAFGSSFGEQFSEKGAYSSLSDFLLWLSSKAPKWFVLRLAEPSARPRFVVPIKKERSRRYPQPEA